MRRARERRIQELDARVSKTEKALLPSAMARSRARELVAALGERGTVAASHLLRDVDANLAFPMTHTQALVRNAPPGEVVFLENPDVVGLLACLIPEVLIAHLDKQIMAGQKDSESLTPEQKEKAIAGLMVERLVEDRALSELIWVAQDEGLPHEFRADASPLAVLGLGLVVVEPLITPPGSSPGMSYALTR
jgi:hypothetical protein